MEAGTRGAARGGVGVVLAEQHAISSQGIQVRSLYAVIKAREALAAPLIGGDKQDISHRASILCFPVLG